MSIGGAHVAPDGELFFVDAGALSAAPCFGDVEDSARVQRELGLPQRMPFVLDDSGHPIRSINRWLVELPVNGCRHRTRG